MRQNYEQTGSKTRAVASVVVIPKVLRLLVSMAQLVARRIPVPKVACSSNLSKREFAPKMR